MVAVVEVVVSKSRRDRDGHCNRADGESRGDSRFEVPGVLRAWKPAWIANKPPQRSHVRVKSELAEQTGIVIAEVQVQVTRAAAAADEIKVAPAGGKGEVLCERHRNTR